MAAAKSKPAEPTKAKGSGPQQYEALHGLVYADAEGARAEARPGETVVFSDERDATSLLASGSVRPR